MSDWPNERVHKPVISSWSIESLGLTQRGATGASTPSQLSWTTANMATFVPFSLSANYLVRKVWWYNGSITTGNIDVGVYTGDPTTPTRLFSSGSTASNTVVNSVQSVSLGTAYLLTPGSYYMAMVCSSTSQTSWRINLSATNRQMLGIGEQATALPLPATATIATNTVSFVPLFGITSGTVL